MSYKRWRYAKESADEDTQVGNIDGINRKGPIYAARTIYLASKFYLLRRGYFLYFVLCLFDSN